MKRTIFLMVLGCSLISLAQDNPVPAPPSDSQSPSGVQQMDQMPTFKVAVVGRTTKAVNYHFKSGSTKVDLKGTELMPNASGVAKVESHAGRIGLDVSLKNLDPPQQFGKEYLTYVLWAITPEGRPSNLGEFLPGDNRKLGVTTDLQAFGLIVTAEPYFGVTEPSELVVMENIARPDTVGAQEYIDAHYQSLTRGGYIPKASSYAPSVLDPKIPYYLHEARNAVRIAEAEGAAQYASDSFNKAAALLQQAEDYQARRKPQAKPIATVAREAVQAAEDSRIIALRKQEDERATREREAGAQREADARAQADAEGQRRATAEAQAEDATRQQKQAQEEAGRATRAQADAERAQAEAQKQQQIAQAAAQASDQGRQQAELARQQADTARQQADQQRLQAERDKEEMRAKLLQQLNLILETRDTARGLVVNMSDVLFDSGKYTLRPLAREKLAKLSGIVLAYPGLKLDVEGHTDSVGGDAYNQRLSEQRAQSVEDYLAKQSVPQTGMTAQGFGKTDPIAPNTTSQGRQQNRRVEIVVSGEVIGTKIGPGASTPNNNPSTPPPTNPR